MSATSICSPEDAALGNITLTAYGRASNSGRSVYEYVYEGTETGIANLANTLAAQGVTFRSDTSAGNHRLVATYGNDIANPALEVPDDLYSIRTELAHVSVWAHPKVWPYLDDASNAFATRKSVITDAVNRGEPLTGLYATDGAAKALYRTLTRQVTAHPVPTRVFTRRREYSLAYANRRRIERNLIYYTRASLISLFAIPAEIADLIPEDPLEPAPDGSQWGWGLRQDDIEFVPAISKVRETLDFVFAAWDDFFYRKVIE